jgi:hypothetical protein
MNSWAAYPWNPRSAIALAIAFGFPPPRVHTSKTAASPCTFPTPIMPSRSLAAALALIFAFAAPAAGQDTLASRAPLPIAPPPRRPATDLPRADSLAVYRALLGRWLDSTLATVQPRRKVVYLPASWSALGRPTLDSIAKRGNVRICTTTGTRGCPPRHYRSLRIAEFRVRNADSVTTTYDVDNGDAAFAAPPCLNCDPFVVAWMLGLGIDPGPRALGHYSFAIGPNRYLAIVREGERWGVTETWREWEQ